MVIRRGDIRWATLAIPARTANPVRRPVLVIQADTFNASGLPTVTVVPITSNLQLAAAPGNVHLMPEQSHLPRESVIDVARVVTLERRFLSERVGQLAPELLRRVDDGLRLALAL